ncbi:jg11339 [Pararge aegeria aegeria]|uniref:Jg11339 protein n=1 Tax=Pararge aegeria aegeria TaxID=348720 RepID=A0A8S4RJZ0_9NEOP|nr:jg11339 [Pararge aegeria aegeria]
MRGTRTKFQPMTINLRQAAIDWFHSYLNGRQQCVYSQNKFSSYSSLTAGVPQGGVLSPLLFAIFINTVSKQLSSSFHLYADDLQVYIGSPAHSICEGIAEVNNELLSIYTWSNSYGLCVNPNKSQVIIIGSRQQLAKVNFSTLPSVRFNSTDLLLSTTVKNLGLLMDTTLSWSPQVAEVSRKVFASIGYLKRWKNFLPVKTKISLAQSLLLPLLDYVDSCYPDLTEELLNKLERLQNICIRFVFGLRKFDHISEYRVRLKWLPIRLRRELHLLSFLYSILNNPVTLTLVP